MDTKQILAELRTELSRINQAITALESLDSAGNHATHLATAAPVAAAKRRGRRRMSPAARKRISVMMRARWAERKAGSPGPKRQAAPKRARGGTRIISAAGRKAIAEAAKRMWAKRKRLAKKA